MGTDKKAVLLTSEERTICERVSATDEAPHSQRARALLALDEGLPQIEVSKQTGLTPGQVKYWLSRFRQQRTAIFPEELQAPEEELKPEKAEEKTEESQPTKADREKKKKSKKAKGKKKKSKGVKEKSAKKKKKKDSKKKVDKKAKGKKKADRKNKKSKKAKKGKKK